MSRVLVLLPLAAVLWREPSFHRDPPRPAAAPLASLSAGELRLIPGVGPVAAGRILEAKSIRAGSAKGIGPKTGILLRRYIRE